MSESTGIPETPATTGNQRDAFALERIRDALRGLRFGTVTVIVQDGVVVQVDRTEKLRLVRQV
ncbi:MAG TPA: DUF2292 domain-containing protein [Candidatus Acidoferrales bacterium]|nr:DUF2292 domain-containing protein [Candidatus Acidoferrales bacterium]